MNRFEREDEATRLVGELLGLWELHHTDLSLTADKVMADPHLRPAMLRLIEVDRSGAKTAAAYLRQHKMKRIGDLELTRVSCTSPQEFYVYNWAYPRRGL